MKPPKKVAFFIVVSSIVGPTWSQTAVPLGEATSNPPPASESNEVVAYALALDSTRASSPIIRIIADSVGNPILGPIIIGGSILLGIPPNIIAGIGSAGAAAQQSRAQAIRNGYTDTFKYQPPQGYHHCAVKVYGQSIRPQSKNRPKLSANGNRDEMIFNANHSRDADTSAVKLRLDVIAVKQEAWEKYSDQCLFSQNTGSIIPLCRGKDCTPLVTGGQWLPYR